MWCVYDALLINGRDTVASLIDVLLQILQKEPVLQNLKKIQLQDDIDILPVLYSFFFHVLLFIICIDHPSHIEAIYYLHKKHTLNSTDFSDLPDIDRFKSLDSLSGEEVSRKLRDFMIAATAKDCSVMISLLPVDASHNSNSFKSLSVLNEGMLYTNILQYLFLTRHFL